MIQRDLTISKNTASVCSCKRTHVSFLFAHKLRYTYYMYRWLCLFQIAERGIPLWSLFFHRPSLATAWHVSLVYGAIISPYQDPIFTRGWKADRIIGCMALLSLPPLSLSPAPLLLTFSSVISCLLLQDMYPTLQMGTKLGQPISLYFLIADKCSTLV